MGACSALADGQAASGIAYKLTPSYYHVSDGNHAIDLNLRANLDTHAAWLGYYQDRNDARQTRAGYENTQELAFGRLILSAQSASHGFVGGSATAEVGGDTFAILGFGRTNLHDYYNLNFDPNDAITFGIGTRVQTSTTCSVFTTRDDRLDTGQRVTHLVIRHQHLAAQRLTLDLFQKSGRTVDDTFIVGNGLALTYDFQPYFVRLARDPYVNFTSGDMTRISFGKRF